MKVTVKFEVNTDTLNEVAQDKGADIKEKVLEELGWVEESGLLVSEVEFEEGI